MASSLRDSELELCVIFFSDRKYFVALIIRYRKYFECLIFGHRCTSENFSTPKISRITVCCGVWESRAVYHKSRKNILDSMTSPEIKHMKIMTVRYS